MRSSERGPSDVDGEDDAASLSPEVIGQRLDELLGHVTEVAPLVSQPRRIGRFQIRQAVGYGAFGIVYEGFDPELNRAVAIKLPRLEVLMDDERRDRFIEEANITASLDHAGIVPVYEAALDGPTPFIVSQFIDGPDLAEWMQAQRGPVDWRQAAQLVVELATAVGYAHGHGVVHRDLKPSNILLKPYSPDASEIGSLRDYQACITDFGLAKAAECERPDTHTSLILGTPLYMAPEQLMASPRDDERSPSDRVDIYSLGVILFELLAGRPPRSSHSYAGLVASVASEKPPRLSSLRPDIPRDLSRVCRRCLEVDPEARYRGAQGLAADLEACLDGKAIAGGSPSIFGRFRYWCSQPKRVVDAGSFMLISQAVLVLWLVVVFLFSTFWKTLTTAEYVSIARDFAIAVGLVHVPSMFIGWETLRKKSWAVVAGVILLSVNCVPILLPLFIGPILFSVLYTSDKPYLVASLHSLIGIPNLWALFLYAVAWYGSRVRSK